MRRRRRDADAQFPPLRRVVVNVVLLVHRRNDGRQWHCRDGQGRVRPPLLLLLLLVTLVANLDDFDKSEDVAATRRVRGELAVDVSPRGDCFDSR